MKTKPRSLTDIDELIAKLAAQKLKDEELYRKNQIKLKKQANKWVKIGEVDVNSGVLIIGDVCNFIKSKNSRVIDEIIPNWTTFQGYFNFKTGETKHQVNIGENKTSVIVDKFGGDGRFPVFIKANKDGVVKEMKVNFK